MASLGPRSVGRLSPSSDWMSLPPSGLGDRLSSWLQGAPENVKCSESCPAGSPGCGHPQGGCSPQRGDQDDSDGGQGHKHVFIKPGATGRLGWLARGLGPRLCPQSAQAPRQAVCCPPQELPLHRPPQGRRTPALTSRCMLFTWVGLMDKASSYHRRASSTFPRSSATWPRM